MKTKKNYANKQDLRRAMEEDNKYESDGKSSSKKNNPNRGKSHGRKMDSKSY